MSLGERRWPWPVEKPVPEQLNQVDLAASGGQCQKVHVVHVDVAAAVRLGVLRLHHKHQVELLRALGAVLQHRTHGRVAVDVGVFALDVGLDGGLVGDVVIDTHQAGVHFADAAALGAVEDVALGGAHEAVLDEHALHHVLHFFHARNADALAAIQIADDLAGHLLRGLQRLGTAAGLKGPHDGICDFLGVKGDGAAVPLAYRVQHVDFLPLKHIILYSNSVVNTIYGVFALVERI